MLTQLVGAVARALIAVVVIATPSLLIPGTTPEGSQVVTLVALALGVFVGMEYAATYPGLIEFRDAPPFNRVRILSLFVTLFLLSLVVSANPGEGSSLALIVNAFGLLVATALDFPFSPVQMIETHLPPGAGAVPDQPDQGHDRDRHTGDAVLDLLLRASDPAEPMAQSRKLLQCLDQPADLRSHHRRRCRQKVAP